jgi:hypothetical protein
VANIDLDKGTNQASFPHEFVENIVKTEKNKETYRILVRKYISGAVSVSLLGPTNLGRSVK